MLNKIGAVSILYVFFLLGDKIGHSGVGEVLNTIWIF